MSDKLPVTKLVKESDKISVYVPRAPDTLPGWTSDLQRTEDLRKKDLSPKFNRSTYPAHAPVFKLLGESDSHNNTAYSTPKKLKQGKISKLFSPSRCTCLVVKQNLGEITSCQSHNCPCKCEKLAHLEFPRRKKIRNQFNLRPLQFSKEVANHILTYRKELKEMNIANETLSRTPVFPNSSSVSGRYSSTGRYESKILKHIDF